MQKLYLFIVISIFIMALIGCSNTSLPSESSAHNTNTNAAVVGGDNWFLAVDQQSTCCGCQLTNANYFWGYSPTGAPNAYISSGWLGFNNGIRTAVSSQGSSGTAVVVSSTQIMFGSIANYWQPIQNLPSSFYCDEVALSDNNDILIFSVSAKTYCSGVISNGVLTWYQLNIPLNLAAGNTAKSSRLFAADLGGPNDDRLAIVLGSSKFNGTWLTFATLNRSTHLLVPDANEGVIAMGTPTDLDIAYDRTDMIVIADHEYSSTSGDKVWIGNKLATGNGFYWKGISGRCCPRVALNSGKAELLNKSTGFIPYVTVFQTVNGNIPLNLGEHRLNNTCQTANVDTRYCDIAF